MKKTNHIFNSISEIQPPSYLKEAVLRRISETREKEIRRKKILFQCGFVFSGASLLFAGIFFGKEIVSSEFWSIAALGFSDMGIVLSHWQSFGLSLLETLPIVALAAMFVPVFFFLMLIKKYAEQQPMQTFKHLNI